MMPQETRRFVAVRAGRLLWMHKRREHKKQEREEKDFESILDPMGSETCEGCHSRVKYGGGVSCRDEEGGRDRQTKGNRRSKDRDIKTAESLILAQDER